jgi:hypothetical protein
MERNEGEEGERESPPTHCLSPFFLSILLTTSPPSFLSIHFLTTYLPPSSVILTTSLPPSSSSLLISEGDRQ